MKPGYIGAFVILVLSAAATMFFFSGAIANHVTIKEAMTRPGRVVQVPGKILQDTVRFDPLRGELQFDIVALDGTDRMKVVYPQAKPENFDTAERVEAVGRYQKGIFRADNLLIKCPSKYNDEKAKTSDSGGVNSALIFGGALGICVLVGVPVVCLTRNRT